MTGPDFRTTLAEATLHYRHGRFPEAAALYRQILLQQPDHALARSNLAVMLRLLGRFKEAALCCQQALVLDPARYELLTGLGLIAHTLGDSAQAVRVLVRALHLQPMVPTAYVRLGSIFSDAGATGEAISVLERVIALHPSNSEAYAQRANLFMATDRPSVALPSYRYAVLLDPGNVSLLNNYGSALHLVGEFSPARQCFKEAFSHKEDYFQAYSNMLMAMNYDAAVDEPELFDEHRRYGERLGKAYPAPAARYENNRNLDRRLRVGYVSADFGRHPTGYFLMSVLAAHDPDAVEVYGYSGRVIDDDLTQRLRGCVSHWRSTIGIDDAALVAMIRADQIDVLVDLSGHTAGNRLPVFHAAPAPVQVSWLGYFNTTGVPAIRSILMDAVTVPPGAEWRFMEDVIRLPQGRFCYSPPEYAPAIADPPCLRRGYPTFGSFNNIAKLAPPTIKLWSALLARMKEARLVLKWKLLSDEEVRVKLLTSFTQAGGDTRRIELRPASSHPAMLAEYGDIDIALDPFPFGGGLTSYEATWMGLPVITMPGQRPASRQTAALLAALDLNDLVCSSTDQFIEVAERLAKDTERLTLLRRSLRNSMATSSICDGQSFARKLEAAYRALWRQWAARI